MIQFKESEIENYKKGSKNYKLVIDELLERNKDILKNDIIIQKEGIATWGHYYYCPEHSVKLKFNIKEPTKHICPVDNKIFTGEPYDGAWWRHVNGLNSVACYEIALLWLLTKEKSFLEKIKSIILEYSKYYPSYEIHGGIPHNGPGKANAQTLCEAIWISNIAKGYDLIESELSVDEKEYIRNNLFTICAEFLKEHRTDQIHNHEIIINGAIGILGILLKREDLINFALYEKYGLYYQLEKGVLDDYFWFEGSPAYHYYALEAFFRFEKFARHTKYNNLSHPSYKKMLKMPLKLLQPNLKYPLLNDMKVEQGGLDAYGSLYEFAYSYYRDWEFAWLLKKMEQIKSRDLVESFFYGVEVLPEVEDLNQVNYHNDNGSGITIIRGSNSKYFLFKHSPFGGEHDHYDRLSISFSAYGDDIIKDLGTTGYGAKMHYDYYKNTGTHSTVMINEENQPPVNPKVLKFEEDKKNDRILIDASVKWDNSFKELDSHTRIEWDEKSYRDFQMRRIILWCNDYFIEVFLVSGPKKQKIDWVLNLQGEISNKGIFKDYNQTFSTKKPFKYLKNLGYKNDKSIIVTDWDFENCKLRINSIMPENSVMYYGKGPNNPSIDNISYLINRVEKKDVIYINTFEAYKQTPTIKDIEVSSLSSSGVILDIKHKDGSIVYNIPF